jgi:glucan 1,3-beta-glucosidase
MLTGVNLGNWLVLEKWMSPKLFDGTSAEDEFYLCADLDESRRRERLKVHRDSYVTERDFAYIAAHGLDAVRIPVPFFVFGDEGNHVGCLEYLDLAFDWAEKYGLKVLIDLHTVPDSQNGFDNGGVCGVCKWHTDPAHVESALRVLEQLTVRYRNRTGLWGIQVLNEPISPELWDVLDIPKRYPPRDPDRARGSEPVPTDFLRGFYTEAYRRIRAHSDDVTVVFHDGFRVRELADFFSNASFEHFAVDIHLYLMEYLWRTGKDDLDDYVRHVRESFAPTVSDMSARFPLLIGEWCIDTTSAKPGALDPDERRRYYRTLAETQLAAWEGAEAWFFWSYKLLVDGSAHDGWDMGKCFDLGYLPSALAASGAHGGGQPAQPGNSC